MFRQINGEANRIKNCKENENLLANYLLEHVIRRNDGKIIKIIMEKKNRKGYDQPQKIRRLRDLKIVGVQE